MNYEDLFGDVKKFQQAVNSWQDGFKAHAQQIEKLQLQLSEPVARISKAIQDVASKVNPSVELTRKAYTSIASALDNSDILNVVHKIYKDLDPILKSNAEMVQIMNSWILNINLDVPKFIQQDAQQYRIIDIFPKVEATPSTERISHDKEDISPQLNVTLLNNNKLASYSEVNISKNNLAGSSNKKILLTQELHGFELEISLQSQCQLYDDSPSTWPLEVTNIKYKKITETIYFFQQGTEAGFYHHASGKKLYLTPSNYVLVSTLMKRYEKKGGLTQAESKKRWKTFQNFKSKLNKFFCGEIIGYDRSRKMMFWNPDFLPNYLGKA